MSNAVHNKAVFLDRDGVLNEDFGYVYEISKIKLCDGVIEGLKKLQEAGFLLIVITNQSGIARGYYQEQDVLKVHEYMTAKLHEAGINIGPWYYCPHHAQGTVEPFNVTCDCRKPKTGLIDQALYVFKDIDQSKSFMIGDKKSDITCGLNSGLTTIQIKGDKYPLSDKANFVVDHFLQAVKIIINHR